MNTKTAVYLKTPNYHMYQLNLFVYESLRRNTDNVLFSHPDLDNPIKAGPQGWYISEKYLEPKGWAYHQTKREFSHSALNDNIPEYGQSMVNGLPEKVDEKVTIEWQSGELVKRGFTYEDYEWRPFEPYLFKYDLVEEITAIDEWLIFNSEIDAPQEAPYFNFKPKVPYSIATSGFEWAFPGVVDLRRNVDNPFIAYLTEKVTTQYPHANVYTDGYQFKVSFNKQRKSFRLPSFAADNYQDAKSLVDKYVAKVLEDCLLASQGINDLILADIYELTDSLSSCADYHQIVKQLALRFS